MQSTSNPTVSAIRSLRREQLALMIGFGLGSLAWNFCWPFLPLRVEAVGVSDLAQVARLSGFLAGATNLITAILGPLWILLAERFGYRFQVMRAHCGTAISMSAIGLARTPIALAGAASMLGSLGGNYPHYLALAAACSSPAEVGRVVGDLQAAGQIGSALGPMLGGLIAARLGVTASFVLSSVVSLTAVGVAAFAIRPDRPRDLTAAAPRENLFKGFAQPDLRWLMILFPISDAAIQGLRPLIPVVISLHVADPVEVATTTGLTATMAMSGTVVSAIVVGRLSRYVSPRWILIATLPATALCSALVPFAQALPATLVIWTLLGVASGATTPAIFAWLGRLAPSGSSAYALLAAVNMIDFAIGPAAMGQASIYGLEWPFRLAAASTLLATLFVLFGNPGRAVRTVSTAQA